MNLGSGSETSIRELTQFILRLGGFRGSVRWDPTRPDGQPRRRLDTCRAEKEFGFKARTRFEDGLRKTIQWYEGSRGP